MSLGKTQPISTIRELSEENEKLRARIAEMMSVRTKISKALHEHICDADRGEVETGATENATRLVLNTLTSEVVNYCLDDRLDPRIAFEEYFVNLLRTVDWRTCGNDAQKGARAHAKGR